MKRREMSAEELLRELELDPDATKRRRESVRSGVTRAREAEEALQPLLTQLACEGLIVSDLNELVETHAPLSFRVVSLLLEWLPKIPVQAAQESIVRSLSAAATPFDGSGLARLFTDTH